MAAAALAAVVTATASAQTPPQAVAPATVSEGVSVVGVDLSGLTGAQASQLLHERALPVIQRRFEVRVGRRLFVLTTGRLRLRLSEGATARRALRAEAGQAVRPVIAFRRRPLAAFVRSATEATYVAPRNARMRIGVRRIATRQAARGRQLRPARLGKAIRERIESPLRGRALRPRRARLRPSVTLPDLRRGNPVILTISRSGYRLRLFRRLRYARSYGIAVGAAGTETPTGLYRIQSKQVNPAWHAPNRPWAGSYAGKTVPGGAPDNPLKARWMGIAGGVGIHGTAEPWSIGSAASHGCIRMRVSDVVDLYRRVPLGSQVLIR